MEEEGDGVELGGIGDEFEGGGGGGRVQKCAVGDETRPHAKASFSAAVPRPDGGVHA